MHGDEGEVFFILFALDHRFDTICKPVCKGLIPATDRHDGYSFMFTPVVPTTLVARTHPKSKEERKAAREVESANAMGVHSSSSVQGVFILLFTLCLCGGPCRNAMHCLSCQNRAHSRGVPCIGAKPPARLSPSTLGSYIRVDAACASHLLPRC